MPSSRRHIYFIVFSVVLLALLAGPLSALVEYAWDWDNQNASQIFLIPVISLTLLYQLRRKIFEQAAYGVVPGILVATAGLALVFLSRTEWAAGLKLGDRLSVSTSAMLILLLSGFLFFYGARSFRVAIFPLLFMVFAIPIPSPVMEKTISILQHGSADASFVILRTAGMPIYRQDTTFMMPKDISIEIAPECSGIRSGISLLILSILACNMFLKTWWRRGILLLVAIPILIFKNGLRISTLSYLAVHVDPRILTSRLHQEGGIPFFILGLLLIYPILSLLIRSEKNRLEKNELVPSGTREVNP